jgi:hypothetical protein
MLGTLTDKRIALVELPGSIEHPVLAVLDLGTGGFVCMNGTGTAEPGMTPIEEFSDKAREQCGLWKDTNFYEDRKYLWYWRPSGPVNIIGNMLKHQTKAAHIRAAAIRLMKTMKVVSSEIKKIPAEAGVKLSDVKLLNAFGTPVEPSEPAEPPESK